MFVEQVACLDFVQWNYDVLEKDDMLLSQRHGKPTDDTGQNIQQLRSSIELKSLMNQRIEAVINGLSNHFSSGYKFSVQPMQNVLEVLSLPGLL